jgi:hypothetical protein
MTLSGPLLLYDYLCACAAMVGAIALDGSQRLIERFASRNSALLRLRTLEAGEAFLNPQSVPLSR